jgi:hypothetical protein
MKSNNNNYFNIGIIFLIVVSFIWNGCAKNGFDSGILAVENHKKTCNDTSFVIGRVKVDTVIYEKNCDWTEVNSPWIENF